MLRLVAIGIWVILVTAGATFASVYLGKSGAGKGVQAEDIGVEQLTAELTSIPILRGGDVEGYLILQLSFATDRGLLEQKKLDAMPYIKDAAFRVVFTSTDIDFRHLKPDDLDELTGRIVNQANQRLGVELVRQVLFQQLNFVNKKDIRTNWIGVEGGGG